MDRPGRALLVGRTLTPLMPSALRAQAKASCGKPLGGSRCGTTHTLAWTGGCNPEYRRVTPLAATPPPHPGPDFVGSDHARATLAQTH
jgi:hypothetical protein